MASLQCANFIFEKKNSALFSLFSSSISNGIRHLISFLSLLNRLKFFFASFKRNSFI